MEHYLIMLAAIESDMGCYQAIGFGFTGSDEAKAIIKELTEQLLKPIGADQISWNGGGVDITPLIDNGVPGFLLRLDEAWWNRDYFHFHHSAADTIDKIDIKHFRQNLQAIAALCYILAEMPSRLPVAPTSNVAHPLGLLSTPVTLTSTSTNK